MAKKLVIVESPSKAKTIKKYLGKDYDVIASQGHIIDLPASRFAVDVDNDFKAEYIKMKGKAKLIKEIHEQAKGKEKIFLATDPDREGEAIAWHLRDELKIDSKDKCRIEFNEITETAVNEAVKKPRTIDMDTVDAQQARRILDRIVGYKISPLLWKKVKRGLSAGRVQSVALRIIMDREYEIRNFVPEEYWNLDVILEKQDDKKTVVAKFYGDTNGKIELKNGEQVKTIVDKISGKKYKVVDIKVTEKSKNPPPPFTTSSLQQDASRRLGFPVKKTMMLAQRLYEAGFITYMRTDSTRVSDDAIKMAKAYICKTYGENYYLNRTYKTKASAQDAHEAIRPTHLSDIAKVTAEFGKDEVRLYTLILNRFVASKMAACIYDFTKVTFNVEDYIFNATGSVIKFDGFMTLYTEAKEDNKKSDEEDLDEESRELPKLEIGEILNEKKLNFEQKFTEPPSRYSEATLVKVMEEKGIGRPSTYAPTISTLVDRFYVEKEGRMLVPTELGEVVNNIMVENFKDIVDIQFTANMEGKLDSVAEGNLNHVDMLKEFYTPFITNLEKVSDTIQRVELKDKETDIVCELCGRNMVIKRGKFGEFLACPGYPECKNAKPIVNSIKEPCPHCGGKVLIKKTKTKRNFYICENNTNDENKKCDYISWNKPGVEPKKTTRKTNKKTTASKAKTTKTTKTTKAKTTKKTSKK